MALRYWLALPLFAAVVLASFPVQAEQDTPAITWKKSVLDKAFRSEGVAVADVNKDGKMDVLVGDFWYEAPDWKKHEIRKPGNFGDGAGGYSQCFACWADDLNGDGWADLVVVGFPGAPCHWYENPQGKEGHWKQHVICKSACNETPTYVDLFGAGKKALVMGYDEKNLVWVAPTADPTQPWTVNIISDPSKKAPGAAKFDHGLGVSDVNGDKRLDVITTGGWWEQPEKDADKPWKFHPANLGPNCADMFAYDVDGDGKNDIISSSAHDEGIWWHQQKPGKGDDPTFVKQDLFKDIFSQSHAMHFVDINGDGQKDLVTGKRWWAHGPKGDKNPGADPVLYWFEAQKSKDGLTKFVPHKIDDASGIGTQFWVGDFNGDKLPDIVISNKRGVFVFEQVRK